jgi:parvulin-like peptidyl-prolyl isomerase
MKNSAIGTVAAVMICCFALTVAAQNVREEVAVMVNDEPVYNWEIALFLPKIEQEMSSQGIPPKGDIVIKATVRRAVDNRLLAQEARRRGLAPDTARVDQKMSQIEAQRGGRGMIEAELIKAGIGYEQFRSTIVQADLIQVMVETQILPGIAVSDEDVAAFYNENKELFKQQDKVHTRHILFLIPEGATEKQKTNAKIRAIAARERAMAGEDFAELAKELSEGPNAANGGDLGFTARGQMVPSFDAAVWALEVGQISEVVESDLGFHVILLEEKVIGPMVPLDEARKPVEDMLRQNRVGAAIATLLTDLNDNAVIVSPGQTGGATAP